MDLEQYRQQKESGITEEVQESAEDVQDAAVPNEATEESTEETTDSTEETSETVEEEDEDLAGLTPKEKTAFQKAMESKQRKIEEKLRKDMESEYEQKYGKHREAIQLLGGDPEKVLQMARDNQMQAEANRLAETNGWDEEQTKWYMEQQKKDQRMKELEVQVEINDLKDNPDYAGIQGMKQSIVDKIKASNNALTVADAYWALGGSKRIEQIKLENQQREIAKRNQKPRTVQSDNPTSQTGEKPLPAQVLKDAEAMGISAAEARRLMSRESPQTIDEWRESRKKAK